MHGAGVLTGLSVTVEPDAEATIAIRPGMALTPSGEEIVVDEPLTAAVPDSTGTATLLTLIFVERPRDYVPEIAGGAGQPRRIEEGFALIFGGEPAASGVPDCPARE